MLSDFITGVTTFATSPLPLFLATIAGLVLLAIGIRGLFRAVDRAAGRYLKRHVECALGPEVRQ